MSVINLDTWQTNPPQYPSVERMKGIGGEIMRIHTLVEELSQTLSVMENEVNLDMEPDKIFAGCSQFQMEERVVPFLMLFSKSSMLLGLFRRELTFLKEEYAEIMTVTQLSKVDGLLDAITYIRQKHINNIGMKVSVAFNMRLYAMHFGDNKPIDSMDRLLVRYFGSSQGMKSGDGLSVARLKTLVQTIGGINDEFQTSSTFIKAYDCLAKKSPECPIGQTGAKVTDGQMRQLALNIAAKMMQLQKEIRQTISELKINGSDEKSWYLDIPLYKVKELLLDAQQRVHRWDLLLKCYEAEVCELKRTACAANVSNDARKFLDNILIDIGKLQNAYVCKYTTKVSRALKNRLCIYEDFETRTQCVDDALVFAFGTGMMEPDDFTCPGITETKKLLFTLGDLTDKEKTTSILLDCLDTI